MKYIIAQKRLCLAALLETILLKYHITNFNQIRLANELGITLPPNDFLLKEIMSANISEDPFNWGMNFTEENLRNYFFKEGINIEFSYAFSKTFEDWSFETFIQDKLTISNIICTVDYNTLFNTKNNTLSGHALLLIKMEGSKVLIFDPGPEDTGEKNIDIYDLYVASKRMNGGLWVFYP